MTYVDYKIQINLIVLPFVQNEIKRLNKKLHDGFTPYVSMLELQKAIKMKPTKIGSKFGWRQGSKILYRVESYKDFGIAILVFKIPRV